MKNSNNTFFKPLFLSVVIAVNCLSVIAQTQDATNYINVKEFCFAKWDPIDGIPYKQLPGVNLGPTSFEIMDNNQVAFLCNSTNEIIIIDKSNKNKIKKFAVSIAPRDFVYSSGYFFVLTESRVTQYDEAGKEINHFVFPIFYRGVERLTRVNNSTYLLLPSGGSLMIESNFQSVDSFETEGWITGSGCNIETKLRGKNSYSVGIKTIENKINEKVFATETTVAGVYVVGSTDNRVVLDVQTFISENPISVERNIITIDFNKTGLGPIIATTRIPDCYFVLSNKEFTVLKNGTIYNMVTAPDGIHIFTLNESNSQNILGYPASILQKKYHFNDHLIRID